MVTRPGLRVMSQEPAKVTGQRSLVRVTGQSLGGKSGCTWHKTVFL